MFSERGVAMSLIEISKEYFETFSNKDLPGLQGLFSDNITLRDWELKAEGKENVLAVNEKIFNAVTDIHVTPLKLYEDGNTVIAELEIVIDNTSTPLRVVDVIVFDGSSRICAIRAYRG